MKKVAYIVEVPDGYYCNKKENGNIISANGNVYCNQFSKYNNY